MDSVRNFRFEQFARVRDEAVIAERRFRSFPRAERVVPAHLA